MAHPSPWNRPGQTDPSPAFFDRLVAIARNRYNGGITTYLEVVTAETAALNNHRAAVQLLTRRLTNGVALVKALGGGWDAASLPPAGAVLAREPAQASRR